MRGRVAAIAHVGLWHSTDVLCVPTNVCSWGKAVMQRTSPQRPILTPMVFGSIHATCLSALVTDRAIEAWYHLSIA
jgi:hypothetical protein